METKDAKDCSGKYLHLLELWQSMSPGAPRQKLEFRTWNLEEIQSAAPQRSSNSQLLDGEGDSFEFIARFAKSHGCYVIVFLDGDKKQRKGLKKIESSEDIPVIRLKPNKDFESLIAPSTYFAAIQKLAREADAPVNADELTQQKFDEWLKSQKQSVREAVFGRQIHEWLDANECRLSKYAIMHEAVNLCDIGEVHVDELRSLVGEMRRAANEGARPGV